MRADDGPSGEKEVPEHVLLAEPRELLERPTRRSAFQQAHHPREGPLRREAEKGIDMVRSDCQLLNPGAELVGDRAECLRDDAAYFRIAERGAAFGAPDQTALPDVLRTAT